MNPFDVASKEFRTAVYGYDRDDVRAFLRHVARAMQQRDERLRELRDIHERLDEILAAIHAQSGPASSSRLGRYDLDPIERGAVIAEERTGSLRP